MQDMSDMSYMSRKNRPGFTVPILDTIVKVPRGTAWYKARLILIVLSLNEQLIDSAKGHFKRNSVEEAGKLE